MLATILSYLDEHCFTIAFFGLTVSLFIGLSSAFEPTNIRNMAKRFATAYLLNTLIWLFVLMRSLSHSEIIPIIISSLLMSMNFLRFRIEFLVIQENQPPALPPASKDYPV